MARCEGIEAELDPILGLNAEVEGVERLDCAVLSALDKFVILGHLFRFLDTQSLKRARLVKKLWRDVGAYALNNVRSVLVLGGASLSGESRNLQSKLVRPLEEYIRFEEWRNCEFEMSGLSFWSIVIRIPEERSLVVKFLKGCWVKNVRELELRNIEILDGSCIMEKLVRSLRNLVKLRLVVDKTCCSCGLPDYDFQEFEDEIIEEDVDDSSGPWTSKLRSFSLRIHEGNTREKDESLIPLLRFQFKRFMHLCPLLGEFSFEFKHHDTLTEVLTDLQSCCPKQKISSVTFQWYHKQLSSRISRSEMKSMTNFINFYSIRDVKLDFSPDPEALMPFCLMVEKSEDVRALSIAPTLQNISRTEDLVSLREMLGCIAERFQGLQKLKLRLKVWTKEAPSGNESFENPQTSNKHLWNYPKELQSLTLLDLDCYNVNISVPNWNPPPGVYWIYDMIPICYPNLKEFIGIQNHDLELYQLFRALGDLKHLQYLSLKKNFSREYNVCDTFFGTGEVSKKMGYSGILDLKSLFSLRTSGYTEDFDVSIVGEFGKMGALKYMRLTVPKEPLLAQAFVDMLEGRVRVEFTE